MPGIASLGPVPNWPTDIVPKSYADTRMFAFEPARVGWFALPPGANTSASAAALLNRVSFTPFFIGPVAWTTDSFQINIATAGAGGAGVAMDIGIYADDGTGAPLTLGGPIRSGTNTVFTPTGVKLITFSSLVLQPGLYWMSTRYTYTTAPTTAPAFTMISTTTWQLSNPTGVTQASVRGYVIQSQAAMPTASLDSFALTISAGSDIPLVGLRRSA